MSTKNKVLDILIQSSPSFVSGEEIAQTLSLSRTAIWKAINELKKEGHQINSTTHKGYQYIPNHTLSQAGIRRGLVQELLPSDLTIYTVETTDSTNKELKKRAIDGDLTPTLLAASTQTETKGRFGRPYFSAANGQGIYFSFSMHPRRELEEIAQYTIISAVATSRAIERLTNKKIQIKWVNDLYMDGKKVCGILSEALTDIETHTISSIIIGIGINLAIPQEAFPLELQEKATSLFPDGKSLVTRNELIAEITNEFFYILNTIETNPYMEEYQKRSFVLGKAVSFTRGNTHYQGVAQSINEKGELVVLLLNGEEMTLSSGEISLEKIGY